MFFPLRDKNPLTIIPFQIVTVSIILVCCLVFLWQISAEGVLQASIYGFGVIPAAVFHGAPVPPELAGAPPLLTLITHMFLHSDWLHLIGNMLYLWVFGDNIEDATGHWRFLVFFLLCGIAAALTHGLAHPDSPVPAVGASGAISGILGAYLMLHPRVRVLVLAFRFFPLHLPAYTVLLVWIGLQVLSAILDPDGEIAWLAHIGGFVAGAILIVSFKRRECRLFGSPESLPPPDQRG